VVVINDADADALKDAGALKGADVVSEVVSAFRCAGRRRHN
jgi:hypothetical protein